LTLNVTSFKIFFALIMTSFSSFVGGFDYLFTCLITFIIVDYLTGVLAAIYNKKLSSSIGLQGIIKKIMQVFLVGVAALIDGLLGGSEPYFRSAVIYFLLANEGISILENVALAGVPIPPFLANILEQLKEKSE